MGAWICKCGERLKEFNPNTNNFYLISSKEEERVSSIIDRKRLYSYDNFWDMIENSLIVQCEKCGRLWFDFDDGVVEENKIVKSLIGQSNIISFKAEPTILNDIGDIVKELERTADEVDCEYELKYARGKYTFKIDDKEIVDESLSGVLQILKYGKKF